MNRFLGIVAALAVSLASVWQATAAVENTKRVALVMGNSTYKYAVHLPNPTNDAELIGETLKAAGFEVIQGTDLDKVSMVKLIDQFTEEAYDADVALIYYAGHGLQVDGHNYLIPVDAQFEKASQLQTRTISVEDLMKAIPPDPAVSVIVLDACRDNPLARSLAVNMPATRSMGSGLAAVQTNGQSHGSGGMLIAYATDPGSVAYDGKDIHSPYTTALARHLTTPGLEIQSALTRVRADVSAATNGAQRPWTNASLAREVFLGGETPVAKPVPDIVLGQPSTEPAIAAPAPDVNWTVEQTVWDEASKRNTIAHYELYLQQFPAGKFAKIAQLNIDQLNAVSATKVASAETANDSTASQPRTAVSIPDDMRQTPGTPSTEAQIKLNREATLDLQLRLEALGLMSGNVDGSIGPKTRLAIGAWQKQSGMVETTFLTAQQHMFLIVQTDPLMPQFRAQYQNQIGAKAATKAASTQQVAPASKRIIKQKTVATQQTVRRTTRRTSNGGGQDGVVREGRVGNRSGGGGFMDSPGGAALVGGLVGGAIGGLIAGH